MPRVDFKRFKAEDGRFYPVPFETYTLEEAAERGIEPLSGFEWRDRFFNKHEDILGRYILTDDEPPLVTPVVKCYLIHPDRHRGQGGWIRKLTVPWTAITSKKKRLLYGVECSVVSQRLKHHYARVTLRQRQLFVLLIALGCGHNDAICAIWGFEQKVAQNYFRKLLVADDKTIQAAQSLAGRAFEKVGLGPEQVAEKIKQLLESGDLPAKEELAGWFNIADRVGMKDEEESSSVETLVMAGMLQSGPLHPNAIAGLAKDIVPKAIEAGSDGRKKANALIAESQSQEASDE